VPRWKGIAACLLLEGVRLGKGAGKEDLAGGRREED